jgi:hypothetical protein
MRASDGNGEVAVASYEFLLIVPGSQLLIYPVLWILMPNEAPAAQFLPVTKEQETASAA